MSVIDLNQNIPKQIEVFGTVWDNDDKTIALTLFRNSALYSQFLLTLDQARELARMLQAEVDATESRSI